MSLCGIWVAGTLDLVAEADGQENAIREARRLAKRRKQRLEVVRVGKGIVAVIDADGTEGGR